MVRDGIWYGLGFLAVSALIWALTHAWSAALLPVLFAGFFLWFFRDPERLIPQGAGLIVSPADGLVTEAEWVETTSGGRLRVSIFLSVFNVHVNRIPISGKVKLVDYRKGGFKNAMKPESALENEQTLIQIEGEGCEIAFKQIAGLLARRIVCNVKAGDQVLRGQRMGLIKFGSRCDVLMPAEVKLQVKVGDRVSGGSTVLAKLPTAAI